MTIPRLVLTILLPPLSVYLRHGVRGVFWLNCLLTLLWYVPGVLHAFVVLRRRPRRAAARQSGTARPAAARRPERRG